ncbi:phage terminase large subunit family protein [Kushneria aurantia]|uniref:Terminase large subunit gp17-like C-terminal domain-containing protein n=1 Tax=Kushneria aurantia TaxID=504092 RepID=A0ABV6G5P1_9GAMM|nr:phage DNA packaging protein GP2 [Kushneria aurantia]
MSRYTVQAGWDDVPHLSEQDKSELRASLSPHQADARSKGIPSLGAGAIFPVPEEDIVCDPFQIPAWWPRLYGLDVGWNKTAAIWSALDRDTDTLYLNSEHYRGQAEAAVHAKAIRMRGEWIPGVIDHAARGRSQTDGKTLFSLYKGEGLHLHNAEKAVEAGLMAMLERLSTGRLQVFSTLQHWLAEYRLYRRDEKGRVVKENDHLMDASRYLVMGLHHATTRPIERAPGAAMPGDLTTGY